MKLDKDFVLKHQFWLLLGVFGLLWLTSLVVLCIVGGGPITAAKTDFEAAQTAIKPYTNNSGPSRPKNDSFLPPWDKYGATFKNHKNTVWGVAWSGDEMDGVDADYKDKPPSDPSVVRHVFRNGSWEVTLLFDRTDQGLRIRPDSTIKNVDGQQRDLALDTSVFPDGVWFRLRQDRPPVPTSAWDRPELTRFAFEGDKPVAWNQTRTLGEGKQKDGWNVGGGDPAQPMQLQQIVTYPWKGQGDMYTWPGTERVVNGVLNPGSHPLNLLLLDPSKPFATDHRDYYKGANEKDSPYRNQFHTLFEELMAPPAPGLSIAAVAFKGSDPAKREDDYREIMKPVEINSEAVHSAPDPEECWLMQEDFWVKRELLYVVRDAMKLAAHMDAVDAQVKDVPLPDPKIVARHVFRNASWEVTLLFDRAADGKLRVRTDSTIKNVHISHRDQALGTPASPDGVWFRLRQGAVYWPIAFEGVPLPWGQQAAMADGQYKDKDKWVLNGDPDPNQPMQLEQLFDATNTPITQIDAIAISEVSHRNANRELIPAKADRYGQKAAPPPAAAGAPGGAAAPGGLGANPNAGGTGGGMAAGGTGGGMPPGGPSGTSGATTTAASTKTPNYSIERNRYLFVTDQSRHLPVAMTLTIDQSHLPEVLAAFANSRLRFQTTQVEFRRVPSAAPSSSPTQPYGGEIPMGGTMTPGGPLSASTGGGPPAGATAGPKGNPNGAGGNPNSMMNPGNSGASGPPVVVDNPNLIEVTIYGVASLYERPPDAK